MENHVTRDSCCDEEKNGQKPVGRISQGPYHYHSDLKMIKTTMYEPVESSEVCKNIGVVGSEVDDSNQHEKNNCLDANSTGKGYQHFKSSVIHVEQEVNLIPPIKPPRRRKYQHIPRHSSYDSAYIKMKNGNGDTSCVDIDHITFENNCKNKSVDVSVQTSPLVPYRLRFWPRTSCDIKYDPSKSNCTVATLRCLCKILTQWILSQIGLTLIVFTWALLGAYAFYKTEGPREFVQQELMEQTQKDLSIELATELRRTEAHNEQWPNLIGKYVQKHESLLLKAITEGFGEGGEGRIWTYPGCILFAVSLLTTLGFGAPVPRTSLGRGTAVIFSAIGIPLHFLLIFNIGNLGANRLQQLAYHTSSTSNIPAGTPAPKWLKWFPVGVIVFYYLSGVLLFGFLRKRDVFDCFLFPLDFTAAGGVSTVQGYIKICYAVYLEIAVTLAALVVSVLQASATRSLVDIGLKLGLLTNT